MRKGRRILCYCFVRALIIGLSQYPEVPRGDDRLRPWLFTTDQVNIRVHALRLALSLARSTMSLPVFAGIDDSIDAARHHSKRGFLDTYKVRLRWLIRFSREAIHPVRPIQEGAGPADPEGYSHLNALYQDEIIWLYNEL